MKGDLSRSARLGWAGGSGRFVSRCIVIIVLAGMIGTGTGQVTRAAAATTPPTGTWSQVSPPISPPGRYGAAMAYDTGSKQLVLFGGSGATGLLGDTWEWNGATWTQLHPPTSPPARQDAAMAYDVASHQLVLFGGDNGLANPADLFGDTWEWNGATWTQLHPPTSPPKRENASMTYDAASGQLLLFGGYGDNGNGTWTWNGITWTQLFPSESPPANGATAPLVYDAALREVVTTFEVFDQLPKLVDQTWTWNGTTWAQAHPASEPPATVVFSMAYVPQSRTVLLVSDTSELPTVPTELWSWNGIDWVELHPVTSPPCAGGVSLSYDDATGDVVQFGGSLANVGYSSQTWTYSTTARVVGMTPTSDDRGYWLVASDGTVVPRGDAAWYGDMSGVALNSPVVGMAATSDGKGYWLVAADGGVFAFGDAVFHGSTGGTVLNSPVVGMATTPDGKGYLLVAADGGVFSFGDAVFHGSTGGTQLSQPVVGMAVDRATGGYWLVAADGGVFTFDAPYLGSTGNRRLIAPVVGIEAAPDGSGYRLAAADGGVFTFNLPYAGSMGGIPLAAPVSGAAADGSSGYWLVAQDGGVFTFGGAPYYSGPSA